MTGGNVGRCNRIVFTWWQLATKLSHQIASNERSAAMTSTATLRIQHVAIGIGDWHAYEFRSCNRADDVAEYDSVRGGDIRIRIGHL